MFSRSFGTVTLDCGIAAIRGNEVTGVLEKTRLGDFGGGGLDDDERRLGVNYLGTYTEVLIIYMKFRYTGTRLVLFR